MAYVAVDEDGTESIFEKKPDRLSEYWEYSEYGWESTEAKRIGACLPKGSIEKLTGKKLTWEDEPVELKEQ